MKIEILILINRSGSPMEDVTDTPFRLICKRLGAIFYARLTSSEALIRSARAFTKFPAR